MERIDEEIFLIQSILSGVERVCKGLQRSKDWDIIMIFADAILPELFQVFAKYGVQATLMDSQTGAPINRKPYTLLTKGLSNGRLNLSFATQIELGRKGLIKSKFIVKPGDRIIFSLNGVIVREFPIFPAEDEM